jgi:flagellar biosynthesis protein FliR
VEGLFAPDIVTGWVHLAALAFARVGTALLMLPGFGDTQIPPRIRIALGLVLTLALMPALPLPDPPAQVTALALLIGGEALIGVFIGTGARVLLSAMHLLGAQIGMVAGISNAFAPGVANSEGATAIGGLLTVAAIALIFATDMHHLMITALLRSYAVLPPGQLPVGEMAEQIARLGASAFRISTSLAAPFLIVSVLMNLGLGLANRVMPTMQVFFVAAPGMILAGLVLLTLAVPAILDLMTREMADWLFGLTR